MNRDYQKVNKAYLEYQNARILVKNKQVAQLCAFKESTVGTIYYVWTYQ